MHSQSIGIGRVASSGTLTLRPNSAAEDPEQFHAHTRLDLDRQRSIGVAGSQAGGAAVESGDAAYDDAKGDRGGSVIGYEEPIMLTQSTHSFLFTEPTCSLPFNFSLIVVGISYLCLILALLNNVFGDSTPNNPFNVPVGVTWDVKVAQYLALLIGLIMEEEIPESLYLLRMISKKTLHNKEPYLKYWQFVFCVIVRIVMGYLFYFNMFVVVAQATEVVDIFFDVLALQFLQQVDDIAFRLAKWDVFGKRLKHASTRKCFRAEFEKLPFARRKKMSLFVKALYVFNFILLMVGMTWVTIKQLKGAYQCRSITVTFGNDVWQDAVVINSTTGGVEKYDLIYSYFNGVYEKEIETYYGRPVYREQNKFDNLPYEKTRGAIIKYCDDEGAWVFMHADIRKDENTKNSDCPWLLRSPPTNSFNLLEVSGDWTIWTGTIHSGATFQTTCNSCGSDAECNYHGTCTTDEVCDCFSDHMGGIRVNRYSGMHCEFPRPCGRIRGDEGDLWRVLFLDNLRIWRAYGRAVYFYESAGNITSKRPDDSLILLYSGSRWFAAVYEDTADKDNMYWMEASKEFHAFWNRVYTVRTHAVSDPTTRQDPIAVDFYRIGRRGEKYGPLGELIPTQQYQGSGYFECILNASSIPDFIEEQVGEL